MLILASRWNIDTHNFTNCSYYHKALVYSNFEQLCHEMENDNGDIDDEDVEPYEFHIKDDLGAVLDQYLNTKEFKKLILEKENVVDNGLP